VRLKNSSPRRERELKERIETVSGRIRLGWIRLVERDIPAPLPGELLFVRAGTDESGAVFAYRERDGRWWYDVGVGGYSAEELTDGARASLSDAWWYLVPARPVLPGPRGGKKQPLLDKPKRVCQSMHNCCVCDQTIQSGQHYYDGGYGRRAHPTCAQAVADGTAKESVK